MRVLVVTTWFPSVDRPSVAPFNLAHVKAIAHHHEVQVVHVRLGSTDPPRREQFEGFNVTRLPFDFRWPTTVAQSLAQIYKLAARTDIVHSMAFSSLGVLSLLTPAIRSRWVHTEHWSGVAFPERISGLWPRVAQARHLLRLPRRISTVSSVMAAATERFTRRGAVEIIPNVVSEYFEPAPQPSWEPLKLVAVGNLTQSKRPELAVDTVRELVDAGRDVTLTWVGDGVLRSDVARRVADAGLDNRITLVGSVHPMKVVNHVRAANVFFLPTAYETFLAAGAEAIASGRPAVLAGRGGFEDFINETNGVIAEGDDPRSFARAILTAQERFMGVTAEQVAETIMPGFGAAAVGDKFDAFYQRGKA